LRNSRGGAEPRVLDAVEVCLAAGVTGITVHPRADQRHITPDDVREIAAHLQAVRPAVEFNMEGDPRPEFIEMVHAVRPEQCTIVPVIPGEITSQAGWTRGAGTDRLPAVIAAMKAAGIRVSLFIDATDEAVILAGEVGADRVELYTEPFARAFQLGRAAVEQSFATYVAAADRAHALGLGINAGHDLDLANLVLFRTLPHLDEVSIGHALMSRALFVGLDTVVREYLAVLGAPQSFRRQGGVPRAGSAMIQGTSHEA
ncbi:MAG: pyridoxine 5'-phosphate synthase, partial [Vicinamibacterales bacterium]